MMTQLMCETCCDAEWRACDCILGCELFAGKCDGIDRPVCEGMRECYMVVDDESPKGYDFGWQCDLLKCISYCLREVNLCDEIRSVFRIDHCEKAKETDLTDCDVNCDGSPRAVASAAAALIGIVVLFVAGD